MQRGGGDKRSLRYHERNGLERRLGDQDYGEVRGRPGYNPAFVVKRGRVDFAVLIPVTGGRMMIFVGVLLAMCICTMMPMLMRQRVQQRHASRDRVCDQRQHYEQCACAPAPA